MFDSAVFTDATWWSSKAPLESLVWTEMITPYINPTDVIQTVVASIAPFGPGELTATSISVIGQTIGLTLTEGQPTRVYTVQFVVTMTNGNVYQLSLNIRVRQILPTDQPSSVPIAGFGTSITWNGGVVSYTLGLVGIATLAATGSSQSTANPLTGVQNIVNAGSGGVVLPALSSLIYGTIEVVNTLSSSVQVYPNGTDQIDSLGPGTPVTCPAAAGAISGDVRFLFAQGATQWTLA